MSIVSASKKLLAPHQLLPKSSIVYRESFILERCLQKNVLHIGCANWPSTVELYDAGMLLHQRLENVCSALAGIDISKEGIAILQNRGVKHLYVSDASGLDEIISNIGWEPEIIVVGEVLEHIDTPGQFLRECARQMPVNCMLLITVPNAFSFKSMLHVLLGHEKINSDHVCYYSYATMKQLLLQSNLELLETYCYVAPSNNFIKRMLDVLLMPLLIFRPYFGDGLIFCSYHRDSILD